MAPDRADARADLAARVDATLRAEPSASPWELSYGDAVAEAARGIVEAGYVYSYAPPDAHRGCCADFAARAVDLANADRPGALQGRMERWLAAQGKLNFNGPHNPRNVIGQLAYFEANPADGVVTDKRGVADKGGCLPGDLIYFGEPPTHVAVVTEVDRQGVPTRFAHSHGLAQDTSSAEDQGTTASENSWTDKDVPDPNKGRPYTEFHKPEEITRVVRPQARG